MIPGGYGILIGAALLLGASVGWRFGFTAGRADAERLVNKASETLESLCKDLEAEEAAKKGGGDGK